MEPLTAAAVLAALLGATAVIGVLLNRRSGRIRSVAATGRLDAQTLGLDPHDASLTVVQFSTQYCAKCPGVRRSLSSLASDRPGIAFAEVDLTNRADLAAEFKVMQTPTVLLVDAQGEIRTRLSGAVTRHAVEQHISEIFEGSHVV